MAGVFGMLRESCGIAKATTSSLFRRGGFRKEPVESSGENVESALVASDVVGAAVQSIVLQKLLIDVLVLWVGRRPLTIGAAFSIETDEKFANE